MVTLDTTICPNCENQNATIEVDFSEGTQAVYCDVCDHIEESSVEAE